MELSESLRLRPLEKSDLDSFVTWFRDRELRLWVNKITPFSAAREEDWFEAIQKKPVEEQPFAIEVRQADQWVLIGNTGLFQINYIARNAELGIFIGDRDFINKGWGTKAIKWMIHYAFNDLNLRRLYLHVLEGNGRAIRCYEKAGFIREGILRDHAFINGRYCNVIVMGFLRSELNN